VIADPRPANGVDGALEEHDYRHVSVKLPALAARQLAAIADTRGSKRTMVALELLGPRLRKLAEEHRRGLMPGLPPTPAGAVRASLAMILPQEVADDLRVVVERRRAVRAQILTRLLVPAIAALHAEEIG
jgi:hypothetical protein